MAGDMASQRRPESVIELTAALMDMCTALDLGDGTGKVGISELWFALSQLGLPPAGEQQLAMLLAALPVDPIDGTVDYLRLPESLDAQADSIDAWLAMPEHEQDMDGAQVLPIRGDQGGQDGDNPRREATRRSSKVGGARDQYFRFLASREPRAVRPATPAGVLEALVPPGRWSVLKQALIQRDKAQPGGRRGTLAQNVFFNAIANFSALRQPTTEEAGWLSLRFGLDDGMMDYVSFLEEASAMTHDTGSRPGTASSFRPNSTAVVVAASPRAALEPSSRAGRPRKLPSALQPTAQQLRRTWRQLRARCKTDEEVHGKIPFRSFMAALKLHGVWLTESQIYVLLQNYSEQTSNKKGAPQSFLVTYEKFLADILSDQKIQAGGFEFPAPPSPIRPMGELGELK